MTDHSELKRLAEAANAVMGDVRVDVAITSESGPNQDEIDSVAAFLQLAKPQVVLGLLAEIERKDEEYDKAWRHDLNDNSNLQVLHGEVGRLTAEVELLTAERDQLKAENEALRKDAERYRWLREKVGVDFIFGEYAPWLPGVEEDMTGLEKKTTDEAIDAAMSAGNKP